MAESKQMLPPEHWTGLLKIPLIVGVSGHIDLLTPEDRIREQMGHFWEKMQAIAGPETSIILLTSIAAGADHLAVKYRPENVKYCVVLPFAVSEYRKDFSGTSLTEFEADLRGAYKVITCPAAAGDYVPAADYVRKHSDVLLTLWDGYENLDPDTYKAERGGTYFQIRSAFRLDDLLLPRQEKKHLVVNLPVERSRKGLDYHRQHRERRCPGYPADGGLSVIRRKPDSAELLFSPFAEFEILKDGEIPAGTMERKPDIRSILLFLRKHNQDPPSYSRQKEYYLRPDMEKYAKAMEIVREDFDRHDFYDALAEKHQMPHKKQFFRIALGSVIVGILGQAWGGLKFSPADAIHEWVLHGVILLYLLGCIAAFGYGRKIAREDHYGHYLEPRVIAELLRLKIFWKLAGIGDSFTDYILEENASYRFMVPICNWEIAETPLSPDDQRWLDEGGGLPAVQEGWLKDQAGYYGNYRKYERREKYAEFFKTSFARIGFVSAFALILIFLFAWDPGDPLKHARFGYLEYYREFIVGICPFFVAALGWLLEKNNWKILGRQYRDMQKLFWKTDDFVGSGAHSLEDKRQMIRELMQHAHRENVDWNDIKRNAKPEPMI